MHVLSTSLHILRGINPSGSLSQESLDALVVLETPTNTKLGRHAIVLLCDVAKELRAERDFVLDELLNSGEQRQILGGQGGRGSSPLLATGHRGTGPLPQHGLGRKAVGIIRIARGLCVGDRPLIIIVGVLVRHLLEGSSSFRGCVRGGCNLCLLGFFCHSFCLGYGFGSLLPAANLPHDAPSFLLFCIYYVLEPRRHRMAGDAVEQHVCFCVLDLIPGHAYDFGVIHLPPFFLRHVVNISDVMA
mmetsp:Transcript_18561/g.30034  ORF Transcript_18561/g.30034 Transcript_18561/m.30034 type:complete len:245 (-) Transcript_18561:254-988(-)